MSDAFLVNELRERDLSPTDLKSPRLSEAGRHHISISLDATPTTASFRKSPCLAAHYLPLIGQRSPADTFAIAHAATTQMDKVTSTFA